MTTIALMSQSADLSFLTPLFEQADPTVNTVAWPDPRCLQAEVAVCWDTPRGVYTQMPNLKLVHSLAAGVDNVMAGQELRGIPVCRVVDPMQAEGMWQFVLWSVLYFHRKLDIAQAHQRIQKWERLQQIGAPAYRVGIMGLGKLGGIVGSRLAGLGYNVSGWTRDPVELPGVSVYAGDEGLNSFLASTDALVCLLPLTELTRGILSRKTFNALPTGATLIHCGRGEHLVQQDLITSLDSGQLRGAVVDVFEIEPLPQDNPLWTHPRVVATPHMATSAAFDIVVRQVLHNVAQLQSGRPLLNTVDQARGY